MSTVWKTPPAVGIPESDVARAKRFNEWLDEGSKFIYPWKQWAHWGLRWAIDEAGGEITRKAMEFADDILEEAEALPSGIPRNVAVANAQKLFSLPVIERMIALLRGMPDIAVHPAVFDFNPYLLGVQNGCVDLKKGTFREADKDDMILKRAGVAYDKISKCPMWEEFLAQVIEDKDIRVFLQRAIGYSLTGLTTEQVIFFMFGKGQNGKSTFIETVERMLGEYTWRTNAELFLETRESGDKANMLASLPEKRFVVGAEMPENARLAEHRIKDLTGGDKINARRLFCEAFNFTPTHKLWFYGNHRPAIHGTDEGIWRRLKMIPFTIQIPEGKRDRGIVERLRTETPGILNWAIKGCLEWQRGGLRAPTSVAAAVDEYREDEDLIKQFIETECALSGKVKRGDFATAYRQWAEKEGYKFTAGPRSIADRVMREPGVKTKKIMGVRWWEGISLKDPAAFSL